MNPRIGCYTPTQVRCGIADYARRLFEALTADHRIDVVAAESAMKNGSYARVAEALNAYDLVHVHYEHAFFLHDDRFHENTSEFFSALSVPLVITFHCLPDLTNPVWQSILTRSDCRVLVHTRHQLNQLSEIVPSGRLTLHFHPSVEPSREAPSREFHLQYSMVANRRLIGMYGFIKRHKNFESVLDALAKLPSDLVLVCIGGPQDERDRTYCDKIRRRVFEKELDGRVIITGYLEEADAHAWIRRTDVFVAPYSRISASGSIATALGCESIILASDLEPNVDLVRRYQCMALYAINDPRDLIVQIMTLLTKDGRCTRLREGARAFHSQNNINSLAQAVGKLYRLRHRAATT